MMYWDEKTEIGQLVADDPARSIVFEQFSIDYYCAGHDTLADVCEDQGVDLDRIVAMLEDEVTSGFEDAATDHWQQAPIPDLIDHIVETHHAYLWGELPRLDFLISNLAELYGATHSWLYQMQPVFRELATSLAAHMRFEEQELFPIMRNLEKEPNVRIGPAIDRMEDEHARTTELLNRLHHLGNDFRPRERGCTSCQGLLSALSRLEKDIHEHLHLENNILYLRALVTVSYWS